MRSLLLVYVMFLVMMTFVLGCASSYKPCSEGGDISWDPPLAKTKLGNKQCHQVALADGRYLNDGRFVQYYPNGTVAIEGFFQGGLKSGTWVQYDEKGRKILFKEYKEGQEVKVTKNNIPVEPPRGAK